MGVTFPPKLLSTDLVNPVFALDDHMWDLFWREDIARSVYVGLVRTLNGLELTGLIFCSLTSPDLVYGGQMVALGYIVAATSDSMMYVYLRRISMVVDLLCRPLLTHEDQRISDWRKPESCWLKNEILRPVAIPHIGENRGMLFMQDNARLNNLRATLQLVYDNNVRTPDWPACSPDLNPVEHVWDEVERRVRRRGPHVDLAHLEAYVIDCRDNISQRYLRNKRIDKTCHDVWCPTNAGNYVPLNISCARSQRYTQDSTFWFAKMTSSVMTLRKFPPFVVPNAIFDGPTSG